jgi:plastocyanin
MRARYLVLVVALLGADTSPPTGGTINGSVLAIKGGKQVARSDVYVYLEQLGRVRRSAPPGAGIKREIRQVNEAFTPNVVVVPVGATVAFPNYENKEHNVFSPTDPVFDLGRYKLDKKGKTHQFDDADEFDIFCDMHPKMWAKVKVVDSAHIAQVVDGKFTFTNVAPGRYKVVAWVRNSPEVRSGEVTVTSGGTVTLDRALHLQVKTRSGCHERKDGSDYDKRDYGQCPEDY